MSHLVTHTLIDGTTQYRNFDDLGSAIAFVEEQRNAGVDDARLFELREIALEVKSYFKVEVADAAPAPVVPLPTVETPNPQPVAAAPEVIEPVPVASVPDDVSYVEAVLASPIDAFAEDNTGLGDLSVAEPVEAAAPAPVPAEGRRGLFGR
ncbi:MAG: hypothetical protein AAGC53_06960 [Actinomycetota bacterium]